MASLGFQTLGSAEKPAIVFLHGGGVSGWMWEPVAHRLQEMFYCIIPDLPEFGRSRDLNPLTIHSAAALVADLIRQQVPFGKACLVGLSEGAQIAAEVLAFHPQVVERAIISSALVREMRFSRWLSESLVRWSFRLSVPPFRNSNSWIRLNMKYSAGIPEEFFPPFKVDFQSLTEDAFTHVMLENQRYRLPESLVGCPVPTLVLVGNKEYSEMKQSAQDLLKSLPNSRGLQVNLGPRASLAMEHNWPLNAPELAARLIQSFFQGQELPTELKPLL